MFKPISLVDRVQMLYNRTIDIEIKAYFYLLISELILLKSQSISYLSN